MNAETSETIKARNVDIWRAYSRASYIYMPIIVKNKVKCKNIVQFWERSPC